jgi:ADP-ribose pyrophosphatase YjhB (NUDIX family)
MRQLKEIISLCQTGNYYSKNEFDKKRFLDIIKLCDELLSDKKIIESGDLSNAYISQIGPGTPKLATRGFIFDKEKVLLVKEKLDDLNWSVPGGWIDVNETPSESVAREVFEETGYKVTPICISYVHDQSVDGKLTCPFHIYSLHFLCEIFSETKNNIDNVEIEKIQWFDVGLKWPLTAINQK